MIKIQTLLVFLLSAFAALSSPALGRDVEVMNLDQMLIPEKEIDKKNLSVNQLEKAPQVDVPVRFVLKTEAEIPGATVPLSDVADCAGDTAICEETYAISLGQAPDPGKQLTLSREKIMNILRSEWPKARFVLQGASVVRVKAAFESLGSEMLTNRIKQYLDDPQKKDQDWRLTLEQVKTIGSDKIRPGNCKIEIPLLENLSSRSIDWLLRHLQGSKKILATCNYDEDSILPHNFFLHTRFNLERQLPVAIRDLKRGDVVARQDLATEWVKLEKIHKKSVAKAADIIGKRLARGVVAGGVIAVSDVITSAVVRRGQTLQMMMRRGNLEISIPIKAMAHGSYGQQIEALYPNTRKKIRVVIKDAETVEYAGLN